MDGWEDGLGDRYCPPPPDLHVPESGGPPGRRGLDHEFPGAETRHTEILPHTLLRLQAYPKIELVDI